MRKILKHFAAACAILIMCAGCNNANIPESEKNSVISDIYSSSTILSDNETLSSGMEENSSSDSSSAAAKSTSDISESSEYSNETSSTGMKENNTSDFSSDATESTSSDISEDSEYSNEISSTGMEENNSPDFSSTATESTSDYISESSEYSTESSSESIESSEISTVPEQSDPVEADDPIQNIISQMSLKELVYQLFFVRPEQVSGSGYAEVTAVDLSDKPVGGIICMGANLQSVEQTKQMISEMQESAMESGVGVFFGVDEEGGRVARCAANLGTTAFEAMSVYGAANDPDEAFNIGKTIGADIKELGFNVDFAPVADVDISPTNELGNRIFSSDPYIVANMVSNVVHGLNSSGVAATLKHFPGLGAEDGNTHTDSEIIIDRTLDQLRNAELIPFIDGIRAGADFVMVGHQQVTAFGDNLPADLSYTAVTGILRGELKFDGIAITDAQEMNTISNLYYSSTAAIMAINAGIDMILSPENFDDAVDGVYNAVLSGEIPEERIIESVTHILTVKQKMGLIP